MQATLSPEHRLLTRAASPDSGAPAPVGPVDWELVVGLADRHRLGPLLSAYLESSGAGAPEPVVAGLRALRYRTAATNIRLSTAARAMVGAVAEEGIPVMALKGLVLLETVYPDVSLRPMVDLDLLAPEPSIQRVEDILLGIGYRTTRPSEEGRPDPRDGKYAYPTLVSADGLVAVDLHRHLLPDATFAVDAVWEHARASAEGAYLLPDHEDLLIHLASHFFKDRLRRSWGSLGQLADIVWTVHAAPVDWDLVVGRARAYGLTGRVFVALMATDELLGPVVPAAVLDALRPASYSASAGRTFVRRRLLSTGTWHEPGYFARLPGEGFSPTPRPLRRLLPDRDYLERAYGSAAGEGSYARLLLRRARRAAARLRPWRLYRDARLNRWMRAMAAEGAPAPTEA